MGQNLLSVCIITYNQEKYISQAIDSVLTQKVNFDFKIIIADDFSTDNTRQIILEYKKKYPHKIILILQGKNVGPAQNWIDLLSSAKSQYIAYLEGDDYWSDAFKLQKQIDFLSSHKNFGLVYTKSFVKRNGVISSKILGEDLRNTNLFEFNCVPTLTVMFKAELFHSFLSNLNVEIKNWLIGDYPFWLWLYCNSNIKFLDSVTTVHRIVDGSQSNKKNRLMITLEAFKISSFFLKKYGFSESFKTYTLRRLFLILTCIKNDPKKILIVLKHI